MKPETIGELNIMNQTLIEKIDAHIETSNLNYEKMLDAISELNKTCDLTLQQALKTNGRVNLIEPLALDYGINRERIKGAVTFASIVGAAAIAGSVMLGKLYVDTVKRDTADMVYTKIINNLDLEFEESKSNKETKTSSKSN